MEKGNTRYNPGVRDIKTRISGCIRGYMRITKGFRKFIHGYCRLLSVIVGFRPFAHFANRRSQKVDICSVTTLKTAYYTAVPA